MITAIARAWAFQPGIVTITSTDTLLQCLAPDYLLDQADNISLINRGQFQFAFGDLVALSASDSSAILKFNGTDYSTLVLQTSALESTRIISSDVYSTTTSPLIIPAGVIYIYAEICGAGGGGGGAVDGGGANTFAAAGGGGSGAFARRYIFNPDLSFITGEIVSSIGAPGVGGVGAQNGTSGGNTTFSIASVPYSMLANGGAGGTFSVGVSSSSNAIVAGGSGGAASGSPSAGGAAGFAGLTISGLVCSGQGGAGLVGNGGASRIGNGNGIGGNGYGAGGSGAARVTTGSSNGGNGNAGFMYLTYFGIKTE